MVDNSTDVTKISTPPIITQAQIITAILIGCVILTLVVLNIVFFIAYRNLIKSYNKKAEKNRNIAAMFVNQVRPIIGSHGQEVADNHQNLNCRRASNPTTPCSEAESLPCKGSSDEESTPTQTPATNLQDPREKSLHVKKHVQIKSAKGRTESWSKKDNQKSNQGDKKGVFKQPGSLFKSVKKSNQDSSAFALSSDFTCVNVKNLRSVRSDSLTVNDIKTIEQFASDKTNHEEKEKIDVHMHRSVSASDGLGNLHAKNITDDRQVNTVGKSFMLGPPNTSDHYRVMPFMISGSGSTSHLSSVTVTHGATLVQISDFGQTSLDDDNADTVSSVESDATLNVNYLKAPVKDHSFHHPQSRKCPSPRGSISHQKEQMKPKEGKSSSPRGSISHPKGHGLLSKDETMKHIPPPRNDEKKSTSPRASFSHPHEHPALTGEDNSYLSLKEQKKPMKDKNAPRKGSVFKPGLDGEKSSKKTKHSSRSSVSHEKGHPVLKADDNSPHKDAHTLRRKSKDCNIASSRRISISHEKGQDLPKGDNKSPASVIGTKHHNQEQMTKRDNSTGLIPGMCSVMCSNHIASDVPDPQENTKHPCERNVSTDTINSLEVAILASQPDNYGEIEIVDHSSLARLKRPRSQPDDIPVLEFQNLAFDATENKNEEYIGDIEL